MQKRTLFYCLAHLGPFVLGGFGFAMNMPLWFFGGLAALWFLIAGWTISECKEDIRRFWKKAFGKKGSTRKENRMSIDRVDYIEATYIVGQYLEPHLIGRSAGVSLTIKKEIVDRFGDVPGARLGEYEYNRVLLHQWLQTNAARLLIENRGDLR